MTETERNEKFMEEIMKRSVFDSSGILEKVNIEWNGITINGKSEDDCDDLIAFLEDVQAETGLVIDNSYVTTISVGNMPMGAGGGFDSNSKTIKLSEFLLCRREGKTCFIHEFSHAIDEKHNFWIEFKDLYKKYIAELGIEFIEDDSNPHKIYADFNPEQFEKASKGNMAYYRVLSIKEFTAVAIQNIFDEIFESENDINEKAQELINKNLNL